MYQTINFADDPHRQKHFEHFKNMDQPHFSITAPIEIDPLLSFLKELNLPLSPALVYLVSKTANALPAFRQRIREEEVVEHDWVHPSFTVKTEASSVFSFCYVNFHPEADQFIPACIAEIKAMQAQPSFENIPGRDDYIYVSALPWIPFTHVQHAMNYSPVDSVPRIAWGKFTRSEQGMKLPLQVQAHHALVDGIDMGRFFEIFQGYCQQPEAVFS